MRVNPSNPGAAANVLNWCGLGIERVMNIKKTSLLFPCRVFTTRLFYFIVSKIAAPPQLSIRGPSSGEITTGSTVDLICTVTGFPAPQVVWDKVDGPLPAQHTARGGRLR